MKCLEFLVVSSFVAVQRFLSDHSDEENLLGAPVSVKNDELF